MSHIPGEDMAPGFTREKRQVGYYFDTYSSIYLNTVGDQEHPIIVKVFLKGPLEVEHLLRYSKWSLITVLSVALSLSVFKTIFFNFSYFFLEFITKVICNLNLS